MDKHNVMGQPLGDCNNNIRAPDLNFRIYNSIIYFIFISCNWDYEDIILQLLTRSWTGSSELDKLIFFCIGVINLKIIILL